ncbi:MAG: hypothetical protein HUJ65_01425 [Oscillospiraceae bacterium]|nr:hypothetical protein [Oscillospiraceae bacterium]
MALTKKHQIHFIIEWNSLFRDITDKCRLLAKSAKLSANTEERGEYIEGELQYEEDMNNYIRREMSTALSYVQIELSKWVWDNNHVGYGRIIPNEKRIHIIAHAPLTFDLSLCTPLARLIESYMVSRTIMMWAANFFRSDIAFYKGLADEALVGIRRIKNCRIRYYGKASDVEIIIGNQPEPAPEEQYDILYKFTSSKVTSATLADELHDLKNINSPAEGYPTFEVPTANRYLLFGVRSDLTRDYNAYGQEVEKQTITTKASFIKDQVWGDTKYKWYASPQTLSIGEIWLLYQP